jgi:NAD-dependent dihydropyrimidine dehydrogenase PreA subunit
VRHVLLALAALLLSGCGNDVAKWSEEVALTDGRTVVVERRAERGGRQIMTGERGPIESWELCYAPKKIYWKSPKEFRPSAFEMSGDTAFVKVLLHDCDDCKAAGFPPDSAAYFAHRGGKWVPVPASEYPGKRWKNLMELGVFDRIDAKQDVSGALTVQQKWERDNINEDTKEGRFIAGDHPKTCSKCRDRAASAVKLEPQSTPTDSFCR